MILLLVILGIFGLIIGFGSIELWNTAFVPEYSGKFLVCGLFISFVSMLVVAVGLN